ncbi:MAG: type II toxin-antitoxin system HicA family toxin [Gammaproteobacteria bacterium]|nr:type II toxin-antitoxin system HicA family toxin [Gammaproteobacteria bacterium]
MKFNELHRLIKKNGWVIIRSGKHVIYEKEGRRYPVPHHSSKEVGKGLEKKIKKEMRLV